MRQIALTVLIACGMFFYSAALLFAAADFVPIPDIDKYLTPEMVQKLKEGGVVKENIVTKDAKGNDSSRGITFIIVNAGMDKIMTVLDDFSSLPAWMPNVKKAHVTLRDGSRVDVDFELSIFGGDALYSVIHKVDMDAGTVQWRIDDSKPKKNLRDTVGAWIIKPIGDNQCAVAFTIAVETGLHVPKFIQDWLSNKSVVAVLKAIRKRVEGKK